MARHYSTKAFFRQMPDDLLARYFQERGLFSDVDFSANNEGKPDELFNGLAGPSDDQRNPIDAEFRDIFDMSCEKGVRAIIDEASWHLLEKSAEKKDFVAKLSGLNNHYERAMVTFLDHNMFLERSHALLSRRHPAVLAQAQKPAAPTSGGGRGQHSRACHLIRNYFHHTEGRGKNCVVEPFRRGELDYFFAYPEDYSQQSIEWVEW